MSKFHESRKGNKLALDDYAISELKRFFLLLDKWDRDAKGEVVEEDLTEQTDGELP